MSVSEIQPQTEPLDYRSARPVRVSRRGNGFLTVCANLWVPGLGFWLIGLRRRGTLWLATVVLLIAVGLGIMSIPALVPALLVIVPLSALLQIALVVDSYRRGRNPPRPVASTPGLRYLAGAGFLALCIFASPSTAVALVFRHYIVEAFVLPTASMSPTISPRDRFLVHKLLPVRRWDVIAFIALPPEINQKYVKRIVGLPGEQVELVGNRLLINGAVLPLPPGLKPYESNPRYGPRIGCEGHPIRLGADEYFLLGDNSPISGDSRYWIQPAPGHQSGALPAANIVGRATWVYWPPKHWRRL